MNLGAMGWTMAIGGAVIGVIVIAFVVGEDIIYPRTDVTVPSRPASGHPQRASEPTDLLVITAWFHAAPPRPFPPDEAHRVVQDHRDCAIDDCPRKRHAIDALIRAGRMKPPAHPPALGFSSTHRSSHGRDRDVPRLARGTVPQLNRRPGQLSERRSTIGPGRPKSVA